MLSSSTSSCTLVIEFGTQDSCSQMHPMPKHVIHIGYSKIHNIYVYNYYKYLSIYNRETNTDLQFNFYVWSIDLF